MREAVVVAREDTAGRQAAGGLLHVRIGEAEEAVGRGAAARALSASAAGVHGAGGVCAAGALPLTPNGKLDRKALPAPDGDAYASAGYEAPQGEIETTLAAIWAELLKLERVGRHDNFFELGGHSLLAVQVMTRAAAGA